MEDNHINNSEGLKQSGDKRKFDPEIEESNDIHSLSLQCTNKIKENNNFESVKKQCNWRPPVKNENRPILNECSDYANFNLEGKQSEKSENFIDKKNLITFSVIENGEELDSYNFKSCSPIGQENEVIKNCDSDKDEVSISSMETAPIEIEDHFKDINDHINVEHEESNAISNLEVFTTENKYAENQFHDLVFYTNENLNSDDSKLTQDRSNIEERNKQLIRYADNLNNPDIKIGLKINTLGADTLKEKQPTISEPLNVDECSEEIKTKTLNDLNQFDEEHLMKEINDCEGIIPSLNNTNDPVQNCSTYNIAFKEDKVNGNNRNYDNQQTNSANVPLNTSFNSSIRSTMEDTFDMTITNSQLEKVEGDVSRAIYKNNFNATNDNWSRIRREHKYTLQRIIKEIDLLNASIIRATNELRSHNSQRSTQNKNSWNK